MEFAFDFRPNPFFRNKTLRKTMTSRVDDEDGEAMLISLEGCKMEWVKGKNMTMEKQRKKQKSKGAHGKGKSHHVLIDVPRKIFFNFFTPPDKIPGETEEEITEEEEAAVQEDFNQCEAFRRNLIPRAVDYYTGESLKGVTLPEGMDPSDLRVGVPGSSGDGSECKQQ